MDIVLLVQICLTEVEIIFDKIENTLYKACIYYLTIQSLYIVPAIF